jgi:hypothetical protein
VDDFDDLGKLLKLNFLLGNRVASHDAAGVAAMIGAIVVAKRHARSL